MDVISIFIILLLFIYIYIYIYCLLWWEWGSGCFSGDEKESANQPDTVERNPYGDIYYIDENHRATANPNRIQSSETNQQSLRVNLVPGIILTPTQNIIRYTAEEINGGHIANPPSYFKLECDQLPSYASLYPSN